MSQKLISTLPLTTCRTACPNMKLHRRIHLHSTPLHLHEFNSGRAGTPALLLARTDHRMSPRCLQRSDHPSKISSGLLVSRIAPCSHESNKINTILPTQRFLMEGHYEIQLQEMRSEEVVSLVTALRVIRATAVVSRLPVHPNQRSLWRSRPALA